MWVLALVPFAGFFVDGLIVPKKFLSVKLNMLESSAIFYDLFHFSKWITLATLSTMLIARVDVFLLQVLSTPVQVGLYSSATQLAMIFPIITGSITTSLLPKFSVVTDKDVLRKFILNTIKFIPYLLLLLLALLLVSGYVVEFLFGSKYLGSVNILRLLIIGFVMGVFVNQISLIAFSLNKVRFLTTVIYIELFINVILDYLLIPTYGAMGAAISNLTIKLFGNILICWYIFSLLGINVKCYRK